MPAHFPLDFKVDEVLRQFPGYFFILNQNDEIVFSSRDMLELFQRSHVEDIGDFFELLGKCIDKDSLPHLLSWQTLLLQAKNNKDQNLRSDTHINFKKRDNNSVSFFKIEISQIKNIDDKELYYICILRDETDIIKEENRILQELEQRLHSTLDNMLEGIQIISPEWKYLYVNNVVARQGKRDKSQLIGKKMVEVYPGIDQTDMFVVLQKVMYERQAMEMQNMFNYPDGSAGWFKLFIQPVPEGISILSIDISDTIRAQEELKKLNENLEKIVSERTAQYHSVNSQLEAFSYSVSHDLRAPLRAITGFSNILQTEFKDKLDEEAARLLDIISRNASKMGELIDDLLTFSRLGKAELRYREIDMHTMVDDIIKDLKFNFLGKLIITNNIHHTAYADEAGIRQVWFNLIANAFKYSSVREEQIITISSEEKEGELVFSVTDNGVGYDDKYADKLFGVFQRLHSAEEFDGNGVGLATVKRVVEKHNGKVWSASQLNKGAAFYFTIPKPKNHDK